MAQWAPAAATWLTSKSRTGTPAGGSSRYGIEPSLRTIIMNSTPTDLERQPVRTGRSGPDGTGLPVDSQKSLIRDLDVPIYATYHPESAGTHLEAAGA